MSAVRKEIETDVLCSPSRQLLTCTVERVCNYMCPDCIDTTINIMVYRLIEWYRVSNIIRNWLFCVGLRCGTGYPFIQRRSEGGEGWVVIKEQAGWLTGSLGRG